MAVTIHNLTNSPFDLLNDKGEKVRIAARGSIVGFEPHPSQLPLYRSLGYFRIEDAGQDSKRDRQNTSPKGTSLAEQYRALTGKHPDGRWSDKRLAKELEKAGERFFRG
jgi:hypothetical protein